MFRRYIVNLQDCHTNLCYSWLFPALPLFQELIGKTDLRWHIMICFSRFFLAMHCFREKCKKNLPLPPLEKHFSWTFLDISSNQEKIGKSLCITSQYLLLSQLSPRKKDSSRWRVLTLSFRYSLLLIRYRREQRTCPSCRAPYLYRLQRRKRCLLQHIHRYRSW